jgi:hypothetical protein
MIVVQLVIREVAGKTEVLEASSQRHFVHQKSYMISPGIEPGSILLKAIS